MVFWKRTLNPRVYDSLRAKYALSGEQPVDEDVLARQYGISRKMISPIRRHALQRLRAGDLIAKFESLVAHCAKELLRKDRA